MSSSIKATWYDECVCICESVCRVCVCVCVCECVTYIHECMRACECICANAFASMPTTITASHSHVFTLHTLLYYTTPPNHTQELDLGYKSVAPFNRNTTDPAASSLFFYQELARPLYMVMLQFLPKAKNCMHWLQLNVKKQQGEIAEHKSNKKSN
jgi:hypothetical protein